MISKDELLYGDLGSCWHICLPPEQSHQVRKRSRHGDAAPFAHSILQVSYVCHFAGANSRQLILCLVPWRTCKDGNDILFLLGTSEGLARKLSYSSPGFATLQLELLDLLQQSHYHFQRKDLHPEALSTSNTEVGTQAPRIPKGPGWSASPLPFLIKPC